MTGQELYELIYQSNIFNWDKVPGGIRNAFERAAKLVDRLPVKTPGEVLWDSFARSDAYNWSKATLTTQDEYEKAAQAVLDHAKENS